MDVDGVLTDAGMYYSEKGDELKKFNTRDAQGIELLLKKGFLVAIITKEKTKLVERRVEKMKIRHVFQGVEDKLSCLKGFASVNNIALDEIAYMGDDINDLDVLKSVGLSIAVNDATDKVKNASNYVTKTKGGCGAVREVCELLLDKNV
jgi:YrbI family 3-deoxy-D-manno-octulosonate 8-phosphate phosphatase